ncbi:MAG: hypothetical protein GWN67_29290 [Phycisphaerae bacterium]|nr:hypothetical protein [Phycisphaerae bacterium]NIR62685.1 hypothetical protein [candidate division Zixibacteria bacterium]NIP51999.1 hypothetical protein [Phycisphaerae bacterium]NIS54824.1 hypothetical protein [Phycisphaerae bacterium]NIU10759.1 hypothetical protein [Phycisphaerae bacterium]
MKSKPLTLLFVFALVFLTGAVSVTLGDWDHGQPYKMHFPQSPDPEGWDVDFTDLELADDWRCTETGWVSDIHFWFSVRKDAEFRIDAIHARIYLDDRKTNPDYSQPGMLLWERVFKPDDFVVRQYGQGDQGWYDPGQVPPVIIQQDHKNIWQANITKISDPFLQQGSEDNPIIYWLDLQVKATNPQGEPVELGWKTSRDHFEDKAVFHLPDSTDYYELYDPITGDPIDLAFVITGEPVDLDFGDAPDRPYPTLVANDGARHVIVPGFCLGAPVRVSQESAPGAGDFDNNILGYVDPYVDVNTTAQYYQYGTPYGASFNGPEPPLTSGRSHLFLVRASDGLSLFVVHDKPDDGSGGSSRMHWEIFGDTVALLQNDDPGEGVTISGGGTVIDSRHGWSTCCTDGFAVGSLDGMWTAIGDFNIPPASTSMNEWHVYSSDNSSIELAFEMNRRVRLDYHTSLDPEPDGQPDATATGDDNDGNDDEDGVMFTSPIIPGHPATVDVIASAAGVLDAWIDWNGNGNWMAEHVFNNVALNAGRNSLTFTVPPTAIPNTKRIARFRFSSTGGLSYTGLAMDGEVEDYAVKIDPKPPVEHLKWSQPPIPINSGGGVAGYKLYATSFQTLVPDQLLSIDPGTGAGSLIGNMTTLTPFGLSDRGTELYTFDLHDGNSIVRLDPATGNTMYKIAINPPGITGEGGLAFRSDGIGFVTSASGSVGDLWSFDLSIPNSTHIAQFQPGMDGLDFDGSDVLYALEQSSGSVTHKLYTIDQATGVPTLVGDTGVAATGSVAGLTFAPDGTLFAAISYPADPNTHALYTLDPGTGAASLVGPIGFREISGLTAMSTTEPALPVYCGWDEPSYLDQPPGAPVIMKVVADDYRCLGSMPVTSVHWWGSYVGWDKPEPPQPSPNSWLIGFWSNIPAGAVVDYSYPEKLLWYVRVPAGRVQEELVGRDEFPLNPDLPQDTCFQYYVDLQPHEIFWQDEFINQTKDNIFWISIVAVYPGNIQVPHIWGWKTRPWHWMDDAVTFNPDPQIQPNDVLTPDIIRPIEYQGESYDMAFELDTDPQYIKWEQPFTGLIHWPHYEDVLSMGIDVPPQNVSKFLQSFDPQGIDVDATNDGTSTSAQIIADDFLCTTTGAITDIHIWGSWFGDELPDGDPRNVEITLSIHDDIPDPEPGNPDTWSMPGPARWWRTFRPGEFGVEELQAYRQGYYNPCIDQWFPNNHYRAFRYDFYIDPAEAFKQEGSPDKPVIYWLDVQARPLSATQSTRFGWKTTSFDPDIDRKDVAVFGVGQDMPFGGPWRPMYHPETQRRLDMAFEITTTTEPELQIQSLVADDWKCKEETPITAAVWWGSYIGYTYQACQDVTIVRPQKPDYFLLNIWTDVPQTPTSFSHPNEIIWEYKAYDYDEVLVGFDKHAHAATTPVAGASCASCGVEMDPAEIAQIRTDALEAAVVVPVGLQKTNMGKEEPVIFTGHDLSIGESGAESASCGSILYAPSESDDPNFRNAISLACGGATVDYFDARVGTPSVSLLSTYDCVMTWINYFPHDANGFGNNLADYVDAGGKVILGQWCLPTAGFHLDGRILTSAYCPVTASTWSTGTYNGDGTDCVHNGITAYSTTHLDVCTLLPGNFSDGTLMLPTGGNTLSVAWRPDRRVYYSAGNLGLNYGHTGDWAQLTCNMCCCGAAREPVFRYSVKLPEENWFMQEDVNNIYWLSVVAVYEGHEPAYQWGWTNHPHAFNDDAVTGTYDPPGGWFWTELYDQTGNSEDMSFMLFTEPECLNKNAVGYADWTAWSRPDCWCYQRQCRGDIDGIKTGPFWVAIPDLNIFRSAFNKFDTQLVTIPNGICADLDHIKTGPFRVAIPDLNIFRAYFNKTTLLVPTCDQPPIYSGPYNFWTKP